MSFLEEPGDLAEVPLAAVLLEVLNGRETGVLTVAHGVGASRVFFRQGVPVGAQSFARFNPLGNLLLSEGLIDVAILDQGLAEMARTGRLQGEVLVGLGAVTTGQVERALSAQQTAYLGAIAELATGRFTFEPSATVPAWTRGVRIAPLRAIVDALEGPQATPLVVAALQQAAGHPLVLAPGHARLDDAFGWSGSERDLVTRVDERLPLDELLAGAEVQPERARAVVAALLLLGLATHPSASGEADATPVVDDLVRLAAPEPADAPGESAPEPAGAPGESAPVAAWQGGTEAGAAHPGGAPEPPRAARDPEEARRRRQRLLQRAMQNMGIGPLSGQPRARPGGPADAPPAGPAGQSAARAGERDAAPRQPGRGGEAAAAAAPPERTPAAVRGGQAGGPGPTQESGPHAELRRALAAALPRARSRDLFERLGVPRDAGKDAVRAAWLQLARTLHPDRFAAPELADLAPKVKDLFAALNEAYGVLSDDGKRAAYLARLAPGEPAGSDPATAAIDFQKAEACVRTRDHTRARAFFEAALRASPRPEYELAYAAALQQDPRGDRARARQLAESASRDPACAERAALLAAALAREAGDDAARLAHLRRALEVNPACAEARRELDLLEKGRPDRRGPATPRSRAGRFWGR